MNRMDAQAIERLARRLVGGELSVDQFIGQFRRLGDMGFEATAELGEATLDLDRRRRCGFAEVVYAEGKSVDTLEKIFRTLLEANCGVLATRVDADKGAQLLVRFPAGKFNQLGRTFRVAQGGAPSEPRGRVAIVTAGTSDLAVAEEARETLDWMGVATTMIHDVGVAGPQRLPARLAELRACDAVVVIAGMEGALPSVVGGYVASPVIAVPTSVGYGASFGGLAALLGMLNSCAANVTVVNIDAGFKGAYVAGLIATKIHRSGS